jgi:hypothetical protein
MIILALTMKGVSTMDLATKGSYVNEDVNQE